MIFLIPILFVFISPITSLDNGLALTPPMGWMHWQRFRCLTDCQAFPNECISEKLFREMADQMVNDGYLAAGYEYLIIDDCWMDHKRDANNELQPNPERFPNGIKALADYVHQKGLKFGIYGDYGNLTCGGYPGSIDYLELDANTFAKWGVDYLKLDGCYAELDGMEEGYAQMEQYLNKTGRPIVFSCSFPAYKSLNANYTAAVQHCNLWRNTGDIDDSWASLESITKWFVDNQSFLNGFAGPGHWNDPDMLIIGNYGLSYDQSIAQMTIWSVMAAPLIMSVDLRTINPDFRKILLNPIAIGINQDALGRPGSIITTQNDIYIWVKPLSGGRYGAGIVSYRVDGYPMPVNYYVAELNITGASKYSVQNVFEPKQSINSIRTDEMLNLRVNPTGAHLLLFTPI